MLRGIPDIISPKLLAILHEMGHGDTIVLGDGNFPGASVAAKGKTNYVRLDGHGVPALLDAILALMPLDTYVQTPIMLMQKMACDADIPIPIWEEYAAIAQKHQPGGGNRIGYYDRFAFYEQAKNAYCVVQTGEAAIYANVIIQKGVIQ